MPELVFFDYAVESGLYNDDGQANETNFGDMKGQSKN